MEKTPNACCWAVLRQLRDDPLKFAFDRGGRCTHCQAWHDLPPLAGQRHYRDYQEQMPGDEPCAVKKSRFCGQLSC